MCIRDSLFLDLETTGLQSTPLFLIGAMTWEDGELVVRQYFCLLYTSDAADDLLCVDLGGRRIIKKKTKETKYQMHFTSLHCRRVSTEISSDKENECGV